MPYTILPDGSIQTEDANEAIRISRLMRNGANGAATAPRAAAAAPQPVTVTQSMTEPHAPVGAPPGPDEQQLFQAMADELADEQQAILRALRDKGRMTADEMMSAMGVNSGNGIGGVLAGVSKRVEKAGAKFSDLVLKVTEGDTIVYRAQPMLRRWSSLK